MRIDVKNVAFCLVDVQERLYPHMTNKDEVEKNLLTLVKGLQLHEVPFIVNEQYKKGIGETIPSLRELVDDYPHFEKTTFSCCKNEETMIAINALGKNKSLLQESRLMFVYFKLVLIYFILDIKSS